MILFTTHEIKQLARNGSDKHLNEDHVPVVKLYIPNSGCIWLLTETDSECPYIAFGLCDLGVGEPSFGSFYLNELMFPRTKLASRLKKDMDFNPKYPISVYTAASEAYKCIVDQNMLLQNFLS